MTVPTIVEITAAAWSVGVPTANAPVSAQANDIFLFILQATETTVSGAPPVSSDWTYIHHGRITTGTDVKLSMFWHRYDGVTMPDFTGVDEGPSNMAKVVVVRGCVSAGTPVDKESVTTYLQTDGVNPVWDALTTTEVDCLILWTFASSFYRTLSGITYPAQTTNNTQQYLIQPDDKQNGMWSGDLATAETVDGFTFTMSSGLNVILSSIALTSLRTPPTISNPTGTATGFDTADGSVDIDYRDTGNLYWIISESSTTPTFAQMEAGLDGDGNAAVDYGVEAVIAFGTLNVTANNLTLYSTYYFHYVQIDGFEQESNIVTSASLTTYINGSKTFSTLQNNASIVFTTGSRVSAPGGIRVSDTTNIIIKTRRDTADIWTAINPILKEGEEGLETDTQQYKVGDGSTAWNDLPYWNSRPRVKDILTETYTLGTTDENCLLICKHPNGCTVTLPKTADNGIPIGFACHVHQDTYGDVILVPAAGAEARYAISLTCRDRYSSLSPIVQAIDVWKVIGDALYTP